MTASEKKQLQTYVRRIIEMRRLQTKAETLKTSFEPGASRSAWGESKKYSRLVDDTTPEIIAIIEGWDQTKLF